MIGGVEVAPAGLVRVGGVEVQDDVALRAPGRGVGVAHLAVPARSLGFWRGWGLLTEGQGSGGLILLRLRAHGAGGVAATALGRVAC